MAAEGRQKVQCRADLYILLFAFCRYSSYTYMILICISITLRRSLPLFIVILLLLDVIYFVDMKYIFGVLCYSNCIPRSIGCY